MHTNKKYNYIIEVLKNVEGVNLQEKISKKGVPLLVVKVKDITHSVCYFGKSNSYRIFFPFPSEQQERLDLKNQQEVIVYFSNKNK